MSNNSFYVKAILCFGFASLLSCTNNENEKKVPDVIKNPTQTDSGVIIKTDSVGVKKNDTSVIYQHEKKAEEKIKNSSSVDKSEKKEKKNKEKKIAETDTSILVKKGTAVVSKNTNSAVSDPANKQSAIKPVAVDAVNKPFVSKYGIIPRDANENNLTVFFNTFPDKNTLIKVNFDGPADAEMNSVKAQIIKVLKKSGYTNVSDRSETIEPKRMPKDIHYELQHDGSVVFWVPIANHE